jgi:hypothetical protein
MESTHYRDGAKALLSYKVSKAPELSDPMDLNSAPTGNTYFILSEIYESKAGVVDHFEDSPKSGSTAAKALRYSYMPWLGRSWAVHRHELPGPLS